MSRGVVGGTALGFGDLAATMGNLEEHHQVSVTLTAEPYPSGSRRLLWSVSAVARPSLAHPASPGLDPAMWTVQREDLGDYERTASSLYRALLELDVLLSQERWGQLALPAG